MARSAVNAEDAWSKAMMARFLELQVMSEMRILQNAQRIAQQEKEHLELMRELRDYRVRADERFARIEQTLAAVLRVLERLPDTIREKIGFGIPER